LSSTTEECPSLLSRNSVGWTSQSLPSISMSACPGMDDPGIIPKSHFFHLSTGSSSQPYWPPCSFLNLPRCYHCKFSTVITPR
jgi:hypothetical protein